MPARTRAEGQSGGGGPGRGRSRACALSRAHFEALLEARGRDLDENPPENVTDLEVYAEGTSAALIWLVLEVLGVRDEASRAAARHVGHRLGAHRPAAGGAVPRPRQPLPAAVGPADGGGAHRLTISRNGATAPKIAGVSSPRSPGSRGCIWIKRAALRPSVDRRALPALLPATLADAYLRGFARYGFDVFDPRHALQRPAVARLIWNAALKRY